MAPAVANMFLGGIERMRGRVIESESHFQEAVRVLREIGDKRYSALALGFMGRLALEQMRWQDAERWSREALSLASEANVLIYVPSALESLAYLSMAQNQPQKAVRFLGRRMHGATSWALHYSPSNARNMNPILRPRAQNLIQQTSRVRGPKGAR